MAFRNRTVAAFFASACLGLVPTGSSADPILTVQQTSIGGGLTRHDVDVDFQDGLGRSGFVQVTFTGPFDPQSDLLQENWPDIQVVDEGQTMSTRYVLRGGTGGGSSVDVVPLAQLVVPDGQGFSYVAVVSRNGQNFTIVPEPATRRLAVVSLAVLSALARRRSAARR